MKKFIIFSILFTFTFFAGSSYAVIFDFEENTKKAEKIVEFINKTKLLIKKYDENVSKRESSKLLEEYKKFK